MTREKSCFLRNGLEQHVRHVLNGRWHRIDWIAVIQSDLQQCEVLWDVDHLAVAVNLVFPTGQCRSVVLGATLAKRETRDELDLWFQSAGGSTSMASSVSGQRGPGLLLCTRGLRAKSGSLLSGGQPSGRRQLFPSGFDVENSMFLSLHACSATCDRLEGSRCAHGTVSGLETQAL